jgi:CheY-like chemotaxis protein
MEISDRRFQELVATIGSRQGRRDQVFFGGRPARTRTPRMQTQVAAQLERQHADFLTPTANVDRDIKEILLVDTDAGSLRVAQKALRLVADVDACADFQAARDRLFERPPDLLVTNLRLQAYNGLHLVHLAAGSPTRCIAYTDYHDLVLAREVQAAGAFYELANRLPLALAAYVHAKLPPRDRRSPTVLNRQPTFLSGRRSTDRFAADERRASE